MVTWLALVGLLVIGSTASADLETCPIGSNIIEGTAGDDELFGTPGDDCILGMGGSDTIHGGNGNDLLIGGDGNDSLYGDNGNDKLYGGAHDDVLAGGNGKDLLHGEEGNDILSGGNGKDVADGGDGNDIIVGDNGKDEITGGNGNDVIRGDRGRDNIEGDDGYDVCDDPACEEQLPDGEGCASDSDCAAGRCIVEVGLCVYCLDDLECDDGNQCTEDTCRPTLGCHIVPLSDVPCDDGNACTQTDSCVAGTCAGFNPVVCTALDQCHDVGVCDPATGICSNPWQPDGALCNDANVCTTFDNCLSGVCTGGAPLDCDDSSGCTSDACDPTAGCVYTNACSSAQVCFDSSCCLPQTCAGLRKECATWDDGCGGEVSCSACDAGATCSSDGACVASLPEFDASHGVNLCKILLEDFIEEIIVPEPFESCNTGPYCFLNPTCCVPVVCNTLPDCVIVEWVDTLVEVLHEAGSVYCDFTEISARHLLNEMVKGNITNLTEILTGGLLEPLLEFVRVDIESLYLAGNELPPNVKEMIQHFVEPVYDGGVTGFAYIDMDTVHIVPQGMPTAGVYLQSDKAAITLGKLVILKNELYDALMSPSNAGIDWVDLLTTSVDSNFVHGVDTMIHELVHVKQYRVDGDHGFLTNYVVGTLASGGYGNDAYEREAYTFTAQLCDMWNGNWCNEMIDFHNTQISDLSLGIDAVVCD